MKQEILNLINDEIRYWKSNEECPVYSDIAWEILMDLYEKIREMDEPPCPRCGFPK